MGILRPMVVPPSGQIVRPSPQAARAIIAPILRRWISEQLLHRVQRLFGPKMLTFPLLEMPNTVERCSAGLIEHWFTATELGGVAISMSLPKSSVPANLAGLDTSGDGHGGWVRRPVRAFFEQKVFFWQGRFYTRAQILSAQANKRGGVHLDFNRAAKDAHVDALPLFFGVEVSGTNYQILVGQDIQLAKLNRARRQNTYDAFDLVAIDSARIFVLGVDEFMSGYTELWL